MKKKTKRVWLIILAVILALIAAGGILYYRISSNPAGMFAPAATPAPTRNARSTMAPLLPIAGATDAPAEG